MGAVEAVAAARGLVDQEGLKVIADGRALSVNADPFFIPPIGEMEKTIS